MIGTSSVRETHSEPRSVQGGGGTDAKITRERNGEGGVCRCVVIPVSLR